MHKTSIKVRFRDTDAMGHVNNAVYLTYLESARTDFFKSLLLIEKVKEMAFILAKVDIDFKIPITFSDHPEVLLWVKSIGTTSWWFEYKIIESENAERIYAIAKSVQVVYNYDKGEKENIPRNFKEILESHTIK